MDSIDVIVLLLLIMISLIGFSAMCLSDQEKVIRTILIFSSFSAIVIIIVLIFNLYPEKVAMVRIDNEVDDLIMEIRSDDDSEYSDDDIQILIFKHLLPYCNQGKYENLNEYDADLVRRSRNSDQKED